MSPAGRIVRWESTNDPFRCGLEVTSLGFKQAQESRSGPLLNPTFVLASLGSSKPADVAKAVSKASAAYGNARACMAFDAGALFAIDTAFLRAKNIGVVLDSVDERTALIAISAEPVEAVRFDPGFVARAIRDGRVACILDAMLGLAHDLGIATLGTVALQGTSAAKRFDFDYVTAQLS